MKKLFSGSLKKGKNTDTSTKAAKRAGRMDDKDMDNIPVRWKLQKGAAPFRAIIPLLIASFLSAFITWLFMAFSHIADKQHAFFALSQAYNFITRSFIGVWLLGIPFVMTLRRTFHWHNGFWLLGLHTMVSVTLFFLFGKMMTELLWQSQSWDLPPYRDAAALAQIAWSSFFFLYGVLLWVWEWRFQKFLKTI